jgi:hypothetical protein
MVADVQDDIDDLMRRKVGRSGSVPVVVVGAGAVGGAVATFNKYVLIPNNYHEEFGFDDALVSCIDEQGRAWGRGASGSYPGPFYEHLFRENLSTKTFEKVLDIETDYMTPPGEIIQLCCAKDGTLWCFGNYGYYGGDDTYVVYKLGTSDDPEATGEVEHTLVPSSNVYVDGLAMDSESRHWIGLTNYNLFPNVYAFFCLDGDISLEVPALDRPISTGITSSDWLVCSWGQRQVVFAKIGNDHQLGNFGMILNDISYLGAGRFCLDPLDNKLKALATNDNFNRYFVDNEYAYVIYVINDNYLPS